jgi:hypothetical protein
MRLSPDSSFLIVKFFHDSIFQMYWSSSSLCFDVTTTLSETKNTEKPNIKLTNQRKINSFFNRLHKLSCSWSCNSIKIWNELCSCHFNSASVIMIRLFSLSGRISILSYFCSPNTSAFLSDLYLILSHASEQFEMNSQRKISLFA